jgi:hypothetical protein
VRYINHHNGRPTYFLFVGFPLGEFGDAYSGMAGGDLGNIQAPSQGQRSNITAFGCGKLIQDGGTQGIFFQTIFSVGVHVLTAKYSDCNAAEIGETLIYNTVLIVNVATNTVPATAVQC